MQDSSFDTIAAKHGLTPERLDKLYDELYVILACYEVRELQAVTELIENGAPPRERGKGAGR